MINSEALTLALSRRLAIADGRNQQLTMVATARRIRAETKSRETYAALGAFISASPAERQKVLALTEKMFLSEGE